MYPARLSDLRLEFPITQSDGTLSKDSLRYLSKVTLPIALA